MRRLIIAGNWKMHKTVQQAVDFTKELASLAAGAGVEIVLCPPFTALHGVAEAARGTNIALGAQDVYWEDEGAFTGEISAPMLKEVGCQYVIVGHSERRRYFGETDETVNKKVKAVFKHGMTPVVCVGETLPEREAGRTEQVVRAQTEAALKGLDAEKVAGLVIAYEPVWAIGTGKTASAEDAQQVIAYIRGVIRELAGDSADKVRIQYGGSVKPENAAGLMSQPDIDGALVGGASLKPDSFAGIIKESGKV
ncbi:triosephosphate isomerase [Desulfohalotomaculum tongense]|uniref:triose-phosphate isomerase n=1 Tax=Desulforadius tongensis TaxID=1216062 RepID=UPI0019588145|nr:triose-phosphate isomerase [Desulforadius tongensis]MBM7853641.1 triosephosphate isomerase [Desulforadius tongensis]